MKIRRIPKKSINASKSSDKEYVELIKQDIQKFYDKNYGGSPDFSDLKNVSMLVNYDGHSDRVVSEIVADLVNYKLVYI